MRSDLRKKIAHATDQHRPDVTVVREAWFDGQRDLDPAHLVFFEETWINIAGLHGHSYRGERLRSPVPHGVMGELRPIGAATLARLTHDEHNHCAKFKPQLDEIKRSSRVLQKRRKWKR